MKEHPILFSAPMILAILAGTKTQTRRIITNAPHGLIGCHYNGGQLAIASDSTGGCTCKLPKDPFGVIGDRLWVRETCRAEELPDGTNGVRYLADNHFRPIDNTASAAEAWVKLYHYGKRRGATVPPIHAPRWTSRLLLEKVAGRVEQLQSISEADAVAEGVEVTCKGQYVSRYKHYTEGGGGLDAQHSYQTLWASLHGPGSWEANPWFWVEEFKQVNV